MNDFAVPPEIGWTKGDKAAQPIIDNGPSAVFKLTGPLDRRLDAILAALGQ